MQKLGSQILLSVVVATLSFTDLSLAAGSCRSTLAASSQVPKEVAWRIQPTQQNSTRYMTQSHPTPKGEWVKTDSSREAELKSYSRDVIKEVWQNDIDAYGMMLLPEVGVKVDYKEFPGNYGTGKTALIEVSGLDKTGVMRASLALPVSGRFGQATTKKWAETDTYSVYITNQKGEQTYLVRDAKSLDIVTVQEIEIPLIKNEIITLFYDRSGSAGPLGFPEGRIMRIEWRGK